MTIVDDFWDLVDKIWGKQGHVQNFVQTIQGFNTEESVEAYWQAQTAETQADPSAQAAYSAQKAAVSTVHAGIDNPLTPIILGMLNDWKDAVAKYDIEDPANADQKLAGLAADVLGLSATAGVIELTLGAFPNGEGTVASTKVSQLMGWLGFGAVVAAVAHDPVKIGLLRPYQDNLEAHFRNRRPGDQDLFACYQQRSLSSTKVEDVGLIDETLMNLIDSENDAYYDTEIAKWGYSPFFSGALKDAATKTLSFGSLMALAKQGRLDRGMATFSLWGYGLDRRLMTICLDSLDQTNEVANYTGFRAQMEPAYVDGSIDEAALIDFWGKLHIPQDVQDVMLPRYRSQRSAYALQQEKSAAGVQRDLTVSQIQQAYQNLLYDRGTAQNAMLALGYSMEEAKILLDLAEMRRKLPAAQTLKRLPLSDYEKAEKNGLIGWQEVLDRMGGEYTEYDIELERKLLAAGKA